MRIVVGIIVAFVMMTVFTFGLSIAPWYLLGVDRVLVPGTFDLKSVITGYSLVASFVGAVIGGWLAASIGRSKVAVLVLFGLGILAGIGNIFGQMSKPEPSPRDRFARISVMEAVSTRKEPAWFTLVAPLLGVAGILLGGRKVFKARDQ